MSSNGTPSNDCGINKTPTIIDCGYNLKPIVELIENIFHCADGQFKAIQGILGGAASLKLCFPDLHDVLIDIHMISCEISCNHSGDVNNIPRVVADTLGKYPYHNARVVILVAAFALVFGEYWLLVRSRKNDQFARSLDLLRGYSDICGDNTESVIKKFLKAITDVVNTNFAFLEPTVCKVLEKDSVPETRTCFESTTEKITKCVVELSSCLVKTEEEIVTTITKWEEQVRKTHVELQRRLQTCREKAVEFRKRQHSEISSIIASKKRVEIIAKFLGVEVDKVPAHLKENKKVLFIASELEVSMEEVKIVKKRKTESKNYEIIWLPIVECGTHDQTKFEKLQKEIAALWTLATPSKIDQAVVAYIKEEWRFAKETIAVSLNEQGELISHNIWPTVVQWGNKAYPFTKEKEEELLQKSGWTLDFLITKEIHSEIYSWGKSSDTFVCLFGGTDTKWIQEFTTKVREVATAASVTSLKLVYVGNNRVVESNKISKEWYTIQSEYRVHFWKRVESMFYSKVQHKKSTKTDCVMREAMKVLGYNINGGEWAIFGMGSEEMVTANRKSAMTIMSNYDQWKLEATQTTFLQGLRTYYTKIKSQVHDCINVQVPAIGNIPTEAILCPECSKGMEMCYAYRCCTCN